MEALFTIIFGSVFGIGFIVLGLIMTFDKNSYQKIPRPPIWLKNGYYKDQDKAKMLLITTSLLYKTKEEQTTSLEIKQEDGKVILDFYSDCGKFGTDEMLAGWILTPERLLQILSEREDIEDDEL